MHSCVAYCRGSANLLLFLLLFLLVAWVPPTYAQTLPTWRWTAQAGGPDWTGPSSLTTDSQGNVIVVGAFFGQTSFGLTTFASTPSTIPDPFAHEDIFIAKYTATGRLRWVRTAGGAGHDAPSQVATDDEGSIYVTGKFGEDGTTQGQTATFGTVTLTSRGVGEAFLAKYDSTGLLRWVRQVDRPTNDKTAFSLGLDVAVDAQHNVYWTGIYAGMVTLAGTAVAGLGDHTVYLAKLTPTGTVRWLRSGMCQGEPGEDGVRLVLDGPARVYLAGNMGKTATFGPYVFPNLSGGYTNDVFVARYDSLGTVQWATQLGGSQRDNLSGLAVTTSGRVLVSLTFEGTARLLTQTLTSRGKQDVAVACFTPGGQLSWLRQEGSSAQDYGGQVAVDEHASCYALGSFEDLPAFNGPSSAGAGFYNYVLRYDSTGTRSWALPAPTFDTGWGGGSMGSLGTFPGGTVFVAGSFRGTATFPGLPPIKSTTPASTASSGQANLWVAQLRLASAVAPPPSPEALFVPNIITPNGDAYNEQFRIQGLPPRPCALTIYSRWGQQVYHTPNYTQDWDAQGLPAGLYYYQLQPAGQAALNGWVEVVR